MELVCVRRSLRIDRTEHHHEPCEQIAEPAQEPNRLAGTVESAGYEPSAFQIDGLGTRACFDRRRRRNSRYGCGGGRTIHKLAAIATKGKVYGVDSSETSVSASRKTNQEWIKSPIEILHGSVSHLQFPDQMFAIATAVNSLLLARLTGVFSEVSRVLNAGGALVIVAEVYKGGKCDRNVERFQT